MKLQIEQIKRDGGTQPRARIDAETVRVYHEALEQGAVFPPVTVYFDGTQNWLADGFHRLAAHEYAGLLEIDAEIRQGTLEDAQWESLSANKTHGLQRSTADKERAIKTALRMKGATKSNGEIAQHIGCDPKTVGKYRSELESTQEIPELTLRTGVDGRTRNTANIGKRPAPAPAPAQTTAMPAAEPETKFRCWKCHEEFSAEVVHCVECGHHYPPSWETCGNCQTSLKEGYPSEPVAQLEDDDYPPHDSETGEVFPPELLKAALHPMSPAPYAPPTLDEVQRDVAIEELSRALKRVLDQRDFDPRLFEAGLMGGITRDLTETVRDMLTRWLVYQEPQRDHRTINARVVGGL